MSSFPSYLKFLYRPHLVQILFLFLLEVATAPLQAGEQRNLSLSGVNLSARVLLQAAYDADTGLMANDLHMLGYLPTTQPFSDPPFEYSGSEQLGSVVSAASGQDAPVDWVLLEVRENSIPYNVVSRRAGILQRDGDVVEPVDGGVAVNFPGVIAGEYRVGVRHRNHLGVMTAAARILSMDITLIDFSRPETEIFGTYSRIIEGGHALLRGGDSTQDNRLINSGIDNDNNPVLSSILLAGGNVGFNSSYIVNGYHPADLNMDGKTIYSGPGNDVNLLVFNVLVHPGNAFFADNFIVKAEPVF